MTQIIVRSATLSDSPRIASLHAESWRAAYRSILPEAYLDKEISEERGKIWEERFLAPGMDRKHRGSDEFVPGL